MAVGLETGCERIAWMRAPAGFDRAARNHQVGSVGRGGDRVRRVGDVDPLDVGTPQDRSRSDGAH
jgi:hypothetical protein